MNNSQKKQRPNQTRLYWFLAILISFLFHIDLLLQLGRKSENTPPVKSSIPEGYIKFDLPKDVSKKEELAKKEEDNEAKRILEAPLLPTQKPPEAEFLGQTDHQAKKLMKMKRREYEKAADPGMPTPKASKAVKAAPTAKGEDLPEQKGLDVSSDQKKAFSENGSKSEKQKKQEHGRNGYESLLAQSAEKLAATEMNQGYMDHLNDLVEEGETIDMNTQEYRFIGYFTGMRKAIELVWVYPSEAAQRGLHGQVLVKFIIMPDGKVSKVQVLESSGYNVLDAAIIDAIRSAAPFAPLPKGFHKDRLIVKGAFTYILGSY